MSDANDDRARWRAARDLAELCELGAQFVEGRVSAFPGWGAERTDLETDAIAAPLARLNRAGLLTLASQPGFEGLRGGRRVRQRAFVTGFAEPALAAALLAARARGIELACFAPEARERGPGSRKRGAEVAVTLEDERERAVTGCDARAEELLLFEDALDPATLRALARASYVAAWDPVWGRTETLWDALLEAAQARRG